MPTINRALAAVYARVSSPKQAADDKHSLATQTHKALAYAAEQGYTVPDELREQEVVSASRDTFVRPRLEGLLTRMAAHGCVVVILDMTDRITREGPIVGGAFVHRLREAGITIHFADERLVLDNPVSDQIFLTMAFSAKLVNDQRTRRIRENKESYARAGRYLRGGYPPYGWQFERTNTGVLLLHHNPATFPVLQRIIAERRAGNSFFGIARRLNGDQVPPPRAGTRHGWSTSTVCKLLRHPVNAGEPASFMTRTVWLKPDRDHPRSRRRGIARPSDEWVRLPATIVDEPPLTPAEQRRLLAADYPFRQSQAKVEHLVTGGLLRHAACGGGMRTRRVWHGERRYDYYSCGMSEQNPGACHHFQVRRESVDTLIWFAVVGTVLREGVLESMVEAQIAAEQAGGPATAMRHLRAQQDRLEREASRLVAEIRATESEFVRRRLAHDLEALGPQLTEVGERIRDLEQAVANVEAQQQIIHDVRMQLIMMSASLTQSPAHEDWNVERARRLMQVLGVRGTVDRGDDGKLQIRLTLRLRSGVPILTEEEVARRARMYIESGLSQQIAALEAEGGYDAVAYGIRRWHLPTLADFMDTQAAEAGVSALGTVEIVGSERAF